MPIWLICRICFVGLNLQQPTLLLLQLFIIPWIEFCANYKSKLALPFFPSHWSFALFVENSYVPRDVNPWRFFPWVLSPPLSSNNSSPPQNCSNWPTPLPLKNDHNRPTPPHNKKLCPHFLTKSTHFLSFCFFNRFGGKMHKNTWMNLQNKI